MNELADNTPKPTATPPRHRLALILLVWFHVAACCLSLIFVAEYYARLHIIMFDSAGLYALALKIVPFAIVSLLFAFSRFSFGYFLGFYFYTMVLGYLWLVEFSKFHYDHTLAAVSAFVCALAFLAPALFITSPVRQRLILSARALDLLLSFILIFAAVVVVAGGLYNFRLVAVADIYNFRGGFEFPLLLRYAIGATPNALLPFAFACFVAQGNQWRAATALLLMLLFYPIMLTKLALFAPFWLLFLALLFRFFDARTSVVLSLFLPVLSGVVSAWLVKSDILSFQQIYPYFGAINFRMVAIPSIALDFYNDFFATHPHTYFCQILLLKPFVACPYTDPLSVMMEKTYQFGNMNASLFATEGVASVGPILAPLAVFACGLVISLGNRLSSGLPPGFILLSGGVLPQVFLNVPLTTTLLTSGAALLFLLWYVTPRTMFEPAQGRPSVD